MKIEKVIEIKNVSFAYNGGNFAIEDISFEIEKGAKVMIIGPNGSGKTTLLKAMVGLLNPAQGSILILNKKPEKVRNKIGYVPQKLDFDKTFPITVLEFLQFSHPTATKKDIDKNLNNLGIENLTLCLIGQLSGGQLQRVLIVRALLGNPQILFLDEPVSGIDIVGEQNFYQLIKNIRSKYHVTIIMVSHEMNVVSSIATQVICINKSMLCIGTPDTVLASENIKKLYGVDVSIYKHQC